MVDHSHGSFQRLGGLLECAERVRVRSRLVVRGHRIDRRLCAGQERLDRGFHVRGLDLVEGNLESELDQGVRHRGSLAAGSGLRGSLAKW